MGDEKKTHEELTFERDIGQKALVEREAIPDTDERALLANRTLNEMGENLSPHSALEYLGSCAVHIYKSPQLDQLFFVEQTQPLRDTHEMIASKALSTLRGSAREYYGKKRQLKRSGF